MCAWPAQDLKLSELNEDGCLSEFLGEKDSRSRWKGAVWRVGDATRSGLQVTGSLCMHGRGQLVQQALETLPRTCLVSVTSIDLGECTMTL